MGELHRWVLFTGFGAVTAKRYLVFVRAGDTSLHPQWLTEPRCRDFDLFVSYFGSTPGKFQEESEHYEAVPGLKWPALARLMAETPELLLSYDACWFPDDDLLASTETISRMFDLFQAYDLWLAQPALGPCSYVAHRVTTMIAGARLHFTDFVEVMCPIFSRHALGLLASTFRMSVSGYGLDFLWPHLLGYPVDRIAILDETPVIHTRPFGTGPAYEIFRASGINPEGEMEAIISRYGLSGWAPKALTTLRAES
jgi:hypothetical protein